MEASLLSGPLDRSPGALCVGGGADIASLTRHNEGKFEHRQASKAARRLGDVKPQFHLHGYGAGAQQATQDYALEASFLRIIGTPAIPRLSNNQEDGSGARSISRQGISGRSRRVVVRVARNLVPSALPLGASPGRVVQQEIGNLRLFLGLLVVS